MKTFYQSLIETYGTQTDLEEITIGRKTVEQMGFDKLQRIQSDFKNLDVVSLNRKNISTAGRIEMIEELQNLVELNLSFNLFSSLGPVLEIVQRLRGLKKLKLVGNRFSRKEDGIETVDNKLESLNMSLTFISKELFSDVVKCFTNLKELFLTDNGLQQVYDIDQLTGLEYLNLSTNHLVEIPSVGHTSIKTLILENNKININNKGVLYPAVTSLDLRRNNISTWDEIDLLMVKFPNLQILRINDNPLFVNRSTEGELNYYEKVEYNLMARFSKLTSINGRSFKPDEKLNAELYFLSQRDVQVNEYNKNLITSLELKHGRKLFKQTANTAQDDDFHGTKVIKLTIQHSTNQNFSIDILSSFEIIHLKGIICKRFNLKCYNFKLSYQINNTLKETINNELSLISSHEFQNNQIIYIEKTG